MLVNSYKCRKRPNYTFKKYLCKISSIDPPSVLPIIWGGDFNFVTNLVLETAGGNPKIKSGSLEQLHSILKTLDLCDIWRIRNTQEEGFYMERERARNCVK